MVDFMYLFFTEAKSDSNVSSKKNKEPIVYAAPGTESWRF